MHTLIRGRVAAPDGTKVCEMDERAPDVSWEAFFRRDMEKRKVTSRCNVLLRAPCECASSSINGAASGRESVTPGLRGYQRWCGDPTQPEACSIHSHARHSSTGSPPVSKQQSLVTGRLEFHRRGRDVYLQGLIGLSNQPGLAKGLVSVSVRRW